MRAPGLAPPRLPGEVWASLGGIGVGDARGVAAFSAIVLIGSQVVSNVPLVLLVAPAVSLLPPTQAPLAWALLAFVSTIAGNLTLLGSVANLIVAERSKAQYELTFLTYALVGVPSTLLALVVGVPLLVLIYYS